MLLQLCSTDSPMMAVKPGPTWPDTLSSSRLRPLRLGRQVFFVTNNTNPHTNAAVPC